MPPRTPSPTPPPTDDSDMSDYSSRSSSRSNSPVASIRSKSASPECLATARDMSISPYPDQVDHDGIRSPSPYSDCLSLSTATPDKNELQQTYRLRQQYEKRSPDRTPHGDINTPPSNDSSGIKSASISRHSTKSPASSDHPVGNKPSSSSHGDSGTSSPTSRALSSSRRRHKSSSRSRSRSRSVSLSLGSLVKSQQKERRSASRSRSRSRSRTRYGRRRRESTRSRSRSKSRRRYSAKGGRRSRRSQSRSRTYSSTSSSRSRSPKSGPYTARPRSPLHRERYRKSDRVDPDEARPDPSRCLALFGLSFKTTERQLWNLFAPFGEVKHVRLMTDRYSGESRGFAFVYYTSITDAAAGAKAMNGQYVDGAKLRVDFSMTTVPIERLQNPSRRSRSRERRRNDCHDRRRSYSRERRRSPARERNRDRRRSRSASRRRHRPILKEEY